MEAKFTKGKWYWDEEQMWLHSDFGNGYGYIVLKLNEMPDIEDAHLITSAPEMYFLLEIVLMDNHVCGNTTPETIKRIEGELIKARGESVTEARPVSIDQIKSELTTCTVSLENYLRHNFDIYRKTK